MDKHDHIKTIIGLLFFLLISGLFYLQVIKYPHYRILSKKNYIRLLPLPAMRGKILDSFGRPLADSRICYDVVIDPTARNKKYIFAFLSKILKQPEKELRAVYKRNFFAAFIPVMVAHDINRKTAITLEENRIFCPQVYVQPRPVRQYPYGAVFAHVLGYVRQIDANKLKKLKEYGYKQRDIIGYQGIEEKYEPYLHGKPGAVQIIVDNMGRPVKTISRTPPKNGTTIITTLNQKLQQIAYTHIKGHRGSIIIMETHSGAIRALCSSPSYDNNIFTNKSKSNKIPIIISNPYAPLLNRAISSAYPPGSTFKIVTAAAGLDIGAIDYNTNFTCHGFIEYGGTRFGCAHHHGPQNVVLALAHSCNVFFYELGLRLGARGLLPYAKVFGFGEKTEIDLPGENAGLLPSPQYKRKKFHQNWYDGDTLNLSIGQGYLLATPIQVLCAMNAIANNGVWVRPYIVEFTGQAKANSVFTRNLGLGKKDIQKIKKGLEMAVSLEDGTAHVLDLTFISVAGKTGTAQSVKGKPAHAWFTGYFPASKPQYSVVIMLEYGVSSYYACELLKEILEDMHNCGII